MPEFLESKKNQINTNNEYIYIWLDNPTKLVTMHREMSGRNNTMFIVFDYHHFSLQLEKPRRRSMGFFISGELAIHHKEVGQSIPDVQIPFLPKGFEFFQMKTP